MIRIVKGVYGLRVDGNIIPMKPGSEPFTLDKNREAELVGNGTAEYVEPETENVEKAVESVEVKEAAETVKTEELPDENQEKAYNRNFKKHRR